MPIGTLTLEKKIAKLKTELSGIEKRLRFLNKGYCLIKYKLNKLFRIRVSPN
jgi:hypothetical protein